MKNITLSADGNLIEAVREHTRAENTTLNGQFRRWRTMCGSKTVSMRRWL